ncbi:uncharacterized protein LOC133420532 [Cololabis saira]|uniref:uncharacterized protein LOC133420532 n=1 Tax=Cololabis saira TaxID=129043 RepID=UPI002AD300E2|nr:uncharacterized protein LOC133420532 [Cololabis saira]
MALKAKKVYQEESAVVRNLYFVTDLDEDKKVEVFGHEWTSCPASLFEPDPSLDQGYAMRKGNKADYLAAIKTSLGSSWCEVDRLPTFDKPVVMIVDAMAFIQRHQHLGSSTFHELQAKYLKHLLSGITDNCDCIRFVGDRYDVSPAESLKGEEREKRMKTCPSKMKEYKPHDTLALPEWKGFVQNPLNKANLLNYMGETWAAQHKLLPPGSIRSDELESRQPYCAVRDQITEPGFREAKGGRSAKIPVPCDEHKKFIYFVSKGSDVSQVNGGERGSESSLSQPHEGSGALPPLASPVKPQLSNVKVHKVTTGETFGADEDLLRQTTVGLHVEYTRPEESDVIIVFCPISSPVGSDVEAAMRKVPVKVHKVTTGETFGADEDLLRQMRDGLHVKFTNRQKSDVIIVFCPISSPVGSDVEAAMRKVPDDKKIILVVMHHTRNVNYSTVGRRWSETFRNVVLDVDVLFHETVPGLLICDENRKTILQIQESLGRHKITSSGVVKVHKVTTGETFGADEDLLRQTTVGLHVEYTSPEESDVIIVFCPISSPVGSDVEAAMRKVPDDKKIILVVMHHTRKVNYSTVGRRWSETFRNIVLDVDVLFHETVPGLLICDENRKTVLQIQESLGRHKITSSGVVKVYKVTTGETFGADEDLLRQTTVGLHVEYTRPEESDVIIVFCPISSRVGSDVEAAMRKVSDDKKIILVVMHHTRKVNYSTVGRRWSETFRNVVLDVDVLFHETVPGLLICDENRKAVLQIQESLGRHKITSSGVVKVHKVTTGETFGADEDLLRQTTVGLHVEYTSPEDSDVIIVFCPISSRVGSDVEAAMRKVPDDKKIILVVMHHTRHVDYSTVGRRWSETFRNVVLDVDVLFHETVPGLLIRDENKKTVLQIQESLGRHKITSSGVVKVHKVTTGETFGADEDLLRQTTVGLRVEYTSPEESDVIIVFCPISSRVGSDVEAAMRKVSGTVFQLFYLLVCNRLLHVGLMFHMKPPC